jgi:hypothetical protein
MAEPESKRVRTEPGEPASAAGVDEEIHAVRSADGVVRCTGLAGVIRLHCTDVLHGIQEPTEDFCPFDEICVCERYHTTGTRTGRVRVRADAELLARSNAT